MIYVVAGRFTDYLTHCPTILRDQGLEVFPLDGHHIRPILAPDRLRGMWLLPDHDSVYVCSSIESSWTHDAKRYFEQAWLSVGGHRLIPEFICGPVSSIYFPKVQWVEDYEDLGAK